MLSERIEFSTARMVYTQDLSDHVYFVHPLTNISVDMSDLSIYIYIYIYYISILPVLLDSFKHYFLLDTAVLANALHHYFFSSSLSNDQRLK